MAEITIKASSREKGSVFIFADNQVGHQRLRPGETITIPLSTGQTCAVCGDSCASTVCFDCAVKARIHSECLAFNDYHLANLLAAQLSSHRDGHTNGTVCGDYCDEIWYTAADYMRKNGIHSLTANGPIIFRLNDDGIHVWIDGTDHGLAY